MMHLRTFVSISILSSFLFCSSDSSTSTLSLSGTVQGKHGGIGSFWTYEYDDKSEFLISKQTQRGSAIIGQVKGTYAIQTSGFTKLTVSEATGEFKSTPTGTVAYGVLIPGALFILKIPDKNKIIYMPSLASCPSTNYSSNGIVVNTGNLSYNTGMQTTGKIDINPTAGTATVTAREFSDANTAQTASSVDYSCTNGELAITKQDGTKVDGILTTSGLGIIQTNGAILMLPQDSTIALADLAGSYAGLSFSGGSTSSSELVEAISLTFGSTGSGTADVLSSVESAGTKSGKSYSIAVGAIAGTPLSGAFKYSIINDLNTTAMGLGYILTVKDLNGSGKTFIAGTGQSKDSTNPYFVFAIEK